MLPAKSDVKNFGIQSDAVTFQREWKLDCARSEEHTSELQSRLHLVCRLLLEKKNNLGRSLKHDPQTSSIPIVLLSGSDGGTLLAGDPADADAYVRKPFNARERLAVFSRLRVS